MNPLLRAAGVFGGLVFGLFLVLWLSMSQLASAADPTPETRPGCNDVRTVSVTGAATINVVPDRVLVKLGVEVRGETTEAAMAESVEKMTAMIAAMRALGIAEQDISTDYYHVYPTYYGYYAGPSRLDGYSITNSLAVTLKDANLLDELLIAAFKAGANQVHEVEFSTSELRRHRDEARTLAMQAAREKAELLADAGEVEVGCLLTIDEQSASWYSGSWWGSGRDLSNWAQNTVQNAAAQQEGGTGEDGPVSLGHIAVKADVSVSYSLE